jgi:hypothetical protein
MASIIYLVEHNQQNAQSIVNTAIKSGYEIFIFSKFLNLLKEITKQQPDAILINFESIPVSDDHLRVLKNFFTIVYGDKIDYDLKHRFYDLGVSRVVTGAYAQPSALVQMLKVDEFCKEDLRVMINKTITHTNLTDVHLSDVISTTAMNKRNLVLKINDENWFAKLRIHQGELIDAHSPGKSGLNAALDILQHPVGHLTMQSFSSEDENSNLGTSVFGLLVESQFQNDALKAFQEKFGKADKIFKKKERGWNNNLTVEELYICKLLNGTGSLQNILRGSPYPTLQTMNALENLINKNIVTIDDERAKYEQFTEEDIQVISERLHRGIEPHSQILVLSSSNYGKQILIETVANACNTKVHSKNFIDMTQIQLRDDLMLQLLGIPIDTYFQQLIKNHKANVLATFFIFDFAQQLKFEYKKYFIRQFLTDYEMPAVIGIVNNSKFNEQVIAEFRRKLEIPPEINIVPFDPNNFQQVKQLFYNLVEVQVDIMKH